MKACQKKRKDEIKKTDVDKLTPIEALNVLNKIKNKIKASNEVGIKSYHFDLEEKISEISIWQDN